MIPLLVKEKVQFYYYLDKWKDNMETIHKEYKKHVVVKDVVLGNSCNYKYLEWIIDTRKNSRFIADVEAPWILDGARRFYIYDFRVSNAIRNCQKFVVCTPVKYHYSSGLNHPTAFKKTILQDTILQDTIIRKFAKF